MLRAVQVAGVDTLLGAYSYFPDEGRFLRWSVYEALRHPAYAGLARLALAFGLWNSSAYALLLAVLFVAVWQPLWYGIEERELVERLGDDYRAYRERVPALVPASPADELTVLEAIVRPSAAPEAG
jgi:protein-S-isoprenylcysteine O-methyltransferase Ste14